MIRKRERPRVSKWNKRMDNAETRSALRFRREERKKINTEGVEGRAQRPQRRQGRNVKV